MQGNPVVDQVVRKGSWSALKVSLMVWLLSTIMLSQAGRVATSDAAFDYLQTVQYGLFYLVLLLPLGILALATAMTSRAMTRSFELLRVSGVSDAAIVWGHAVLALYHMRWCLGLVLGLLPLLAAELSGKPAFLKGLPVSWDQWPLEVAQPLSAGATFASIPWLVWEIGLVLLAATLGTALALRWGRGASLAVTAIVGVAVAAAALKVHADWLWISMASESPNCHFGLRCLFGGRLPTPWPLFTLILAVPYLLTLLSLRVPWPRDVRNFSVPQIAAEMLVLGTASVLLSSGELYDEIRPGIQSSLA
jgi:hypothetical protein